MYRQLGWRHTFDIAYALLLGIGIPAVIFHAVQGRWPQALLASAAIGIGIAILITEWREAEQTEQHEWDAPSR